MQKYQWKYYISSVIIGVILILSSACSDEKTTTEDVSDLPCRDLDQDRLCNEDDDDDDGDSVVDTQDTFPDDPRRCADEDGDGCDDCAVLALPDPKQDGEDFDQDGICDFGDDDIDRAESKCGYL